VVGRAVSRDCGPGDADPGARINLVQNDQKKADGCAIAAGAAEGLEPDKNIRLELRDDDDDEKLAENVARQIESDPDVIAVIGHTASGTTRRAAPFYSEAEIPLLMPVATSPNVDRPYSHDLQRKLGEGPALDQILHLPDWLDKHWDPDTRLPNTFRLIPNDSRAQAPALAFAASHISTGKTLLVADVSVEVDKDYVDPLREALKPILRSTSGDVEEIVIRDKDLRGGSDLPYETSDHMLKAQLVVFCGTKERAKAMLDSVKGRQKEKGGHWPSFLLSDSSRPMSGIPDGVSVHVTFPVPQFSPPLNADQKRIPHAAVSQGGTSYEVFAYDAAKLLSRAISEIRREKHPVNRATVLEKLSQTVEFQACAKYTFVHGENIHPDYYVYSKGPSIELGKACGSSSPAPPKAVGGPNGEPVYNCAIAPDDLHKLTAVKE
jgi:ABC-type branched-subunit amino acid transport system substrate-binding protein